MKGRKRSFLRAGGREREFRTPPGRTGSTETATLETTHRLRLAFISCRHTGLVQSRAFVYSTLLPPSGVTFFLPSCVMIQRHLVRLRCRGSVATREEALSVARPRWLLPLNPRCSHIRLSEAGALVPAIAFAVAAVRGNCVAPAARPMARLRADRGSGAAAILDRIDATKRGCLGRLRQRFGPGCNIAVRPAVIKRAQVGESGPTDDDPSAAALRGAAGGEDLAPAPSPEPRGGEQLPTDPAAASGDDIRARSVDHDEEEEPNRHRASVVSRFAGFNVTIATAVASDASVALQSVTDLALGTDLAGAPQAAVATQPPSTGGLDVASGGGTGLASPPFQQTDAGATSDLSATGNVSASHHKLLAPVGYEKALDELRYLAVGQNKTLRFSLSHDPANPDVGARVKCIAFVRDDWAFVAHFVTLLSQQGSTATRALRNAARAATESLRLSAVANGEDEEDASELRIFFNERQVGDDGDSDGRCAAGARRPPLHSSSAGTFDFLARSQDDEFFCRFADFATTTRDAAGRSSSRPFSSSCALAGQRVAVEVRVWYDGDASVAASGGALSTTPLPKTPTRLILPINGGAPILVSPPSSPAGASISHGSGAPPAAAHGGKAAAGTLNGVFNDAACARITITDEFDNRVSFSSLKQRTRHAAVRSCALQAYKHHREEGGGSSGSTRRRPFLSTLNWFAERYCLQLSIETSLKMQAAEKQLGAQPFAGQFSSSASFYETDVSVKLSTAPLGSGSTASIWGTVAYGGRELAAAQSPGEYLTEVRCQLSALQFLFLRFPKTSATWEVTFKDILAEGAHLERLDVVQRLKGSKITPYNVLGECTYAHLNQYFAVNYATLDAGVDAGAQLMHQATVHVSHPVTSARLVLGTGQHRLRGQAWRIACSNALRNNFPRQYDMVKNRDDFKSAAACSLNTAGGHAAGSGGKYEGLAMQPKYQHIPREKRVSFMTSIFHVLKACLIEDFGVGDVMVDTVQPNPNNWVSTLQVRYDVDGSWATFARSVNCANKADAKRLLITDTCRRLFPKEFAAYVELGRPDTALAAGAKPAISVASVCGSSSAINATASVTSSEASQLPKLMFDTRSSVIVALAEKVIAPFFWDVVFSPSFPEDRLTQLPQQQLRPGRGMTGDSIVPSCLTAMPRQEGPSGDAPDERFAFALNVVETIDSAAAAAGSRHARVVPSSHVVPGMSGSIEIRSVCELTLQGAASSPPSSRLSPEGENAVAQDGVTAPSAALPENLTTTLCRQSLGRRLTLLTANDEEVVVEPLETAADKDSADSNLTASATAASSRQQLYDVCLCEELERFVGRVIDARYVAAWVSLFRNAGDVGSVPLREDDDRELGAQRSDSITLALLLSHMRHTLLWSEQLNSLASNAIRTVVDLSQQLFSQVFGQPLLLTEPVRDPSAQVWITSAKLVSLHPKLCLAEGRAGTKKEAIRRCHVKALVTHFPRQLRYLSRHVVSLQSIVDDVLREAAELFLPEEDCFVTVWQRHAFDTFANDTVVAAHRGDANGKLCDVNEREGTGSAAAEDTRSNHNAAVSRDPTTAAASCFVSRDFRASAAPWQPDFAVDAASDSSTTRRHRTDGVSISPIVSEALEALRLLWFREQPDSFVTFRFLAPPRTTHAIDNGPGHAEQAIGSEPSVDGNHHSVVAFSSPSPMCNGIVRLPAGTVCVIEAFQLSMALRDVVSTSEHPRAASPPLIDESTPHHRTASSSSLRSRLTTLLGHRQEIARTTEAGGDRSALALLNIAALNAVRAVFPDHEARVAALVLAASQEDEAAPWCWG